MASLFPRFLLLLTLSAAAPRFSRAAGQEHTDTIHIPPKIEWEKIAELPPRAGEQKNPGLAGVFAGAQEDVFIIAGGTNYPKGRPWTGAPRAVVAMSTHGRSGVRRWILGSVTEKVVRHGDDPVLIVRGAA